MAARKYIDCREHSESENKCSIAISADTDEELIKVATQHAISAHGMEDGPELRDALRSMIKEGSPTPV